jgi:hypothetical protein
MNNSQSAQAQSEGHGGAALSLVEANNIRLTADNHTGRLFSIWHRLNDISGKIHGDSVPGYGAPAVPSQAVKPGNMNASEPQPLLHSINQIGTRLSDIEDALKHIEAGL